MKTYRTLGILWLLFCGYGCFNLLRELLALPSTIGLWPAWFVLAGLCLLDLAGIVASIYLFRGARWARWFVCCFYGAFRYRLYGDGEITSHLHCLYYCVCLCFRDRLSCAFIVA